MQFGELEQNLADAPTQEVRASFLSDDFEERLCSVPGRPIPREEWLGESNSATGKFSQQSVHLYDNLAVYSALLNTDVTKDTIVDIWRNGAGGWKLSVRYRCPAGGAMPPEPAVQKKY